MPSQLVMAAMALQMAAGGGTLTSPATPISCAPAIEKASPLLAAGEKAIAQRNGRAAGAYFDAALRAIGNAYHRQSMRDDTGMRLVLANVQESKGQFAKAASLKRRVLVERLQLCGVSTR